MSVAYICKKIIQASIGIASIVVFLSAFTASAQTGCLKYPSNSAPATDYGVSWDVTSTLKELLIKSNCPTSGTSLDITIGRGNTSQYIWSTMYVYGGSSWTSYVLTGTSGGEGWLIGVGNKTITTPFSPTASNPLFFVGYVCTPSGSSWKCGCRNASCTTKHWQLQGYEGVTGGGTTGGGTGGSSGSTDEIFLQSSVHGTGSGIAAIGTGGIIDLTTSECFNRPQAKIKYLPVGRYKRPVMIQGPVGGTYDFRGAMIEANPLRIPFMVNNAHDACVVGPTVQGQQSRNLSWSQMKGGDDHAYEGDGITMQNPSGKTIIEGAWIDNMEDGIGPPFDYVPDRSATFSIRHVYARHIRDDFIENDGCLSGDMHDTFIDGTWTFYSARPSDVLKGEWKGSASLTVRDSLIRHTCMNDPREKISTCSGNDNTGVFYKGYSDCKVTMNMRDSVILMEGVREGDNNFPSGTYQNVTLVWAGPGNYPGGPVPSGVTVTKDMSVWNTAKSAWLSRHGCDASGNNCAYLKHSEINKTPPTYTKPLILMTTSPRSATAADAGGNGMGVEWWTENVGSCTPRGDLFSPGSAKSGSQHIKRINPGTIMFGLSCTTSSGVVSKAERGLWISLKKDTTKPSVPDAVSASAGDAGITVRWNESSDNSSVISYRVYRNGEWIVNVSSDPVYVDAAVTPGTTYTYQIEAYDAFGNLSGKSASASAEAE